MSKIRIFVRHLMLFCSDPASHLKKSFRNQHTLCSYHVFHLFAYVLFFLFCQLCGSDTISSHIQRIRTFINYMLNPFQTTFSSFFPYYPAHIVFSKKINTSEQKSTIDPFIKALWGKGSMFLCLIHNSLQECIIRFRIKLNIDFSCHLIGKIEQLFSR